MDGASHLQQVFTIVIPMSGPIIGTLAILSFLAMWNDFLLPYIILRQGTLVLFQFNFFGTFTKDYGALTASLVMTATPIPRTAAMVVFGDLDMTVIDELPPGRQPVATSWLRTPLEAEEAWSRVREQVATGHRAFVVCPLVDGSDRVEAASATAEAERLAAHELEGLRVGLLHGQMKPKEKEEVMKTRPLFWPS